MNEAPRHVLVTGASSGLGRAVALAYAAPGRRLTLLGRDPPRLAEVAAAAAGRGAEVATVVADVRDRDAMAIAIAAADDARPLDLVLANAGIAAAADARDVLAVNTLGVWHTVEPALARMGARGRGQLALMSSLAGRRGLPGAAAYCAAKAAVRVLAESLRVDWAPRGVRISAILPGFVDTPLTRRNRFAMPWLMAPEKAAERIRRGLDRDRAEIVFPRRLAVAVRLLTLLPPWAAAPLLRRGRGDAAEPRDVRPTSS
jgi:NAD(P)-dependent dehydrogenase (short-subunit alcohol dehydrogenase family)